MFATALLIICALSTILTATRESLATNRDALQVQEFSSEIDRIDEVLTMSLSMAATTGQSRWLAQHGEYEAKTSGAIERLRQVSPMIFDREFGNDVYAAIGRLSAASRRISDLVEAGDFEAAEAILGSESYKLDKQKYALANDRVQMAMGEHVAEATIATHAYAVALIFLTILLCVVATIEWSRIYRTQHAIQAAAHLEKVRAERAEAEALSNAKSQVIANVSHELRTPLTAILGYADLLAEDDYPESDKLAAASTIQRHGSHLLQVINDLLDISKIEFGAMEVNACATDPAVLVGDVLELLRVRAQEKDIKLARSFATSVPRSIYTDPVRVRQILINLIGNAIKFTSAGEVRVTVWFELLGDEPQLLVAVRDTGIGMTSEQIERLFLPFEQGDNTTERRFGGTGLGLTIAHHYAQLLDGEITADSVVGEGSTFTFTMPIVRTDESLLWHPDAAGDSQYDADDESGAGGESAAAAKAGEIDLTGLKVLVVEDGPDNQRLLTYFLCRAGADVMVADHGKAALDLIEADEGAFDLVVMDMQMPVLDGYQATQLLRQQGFSRPIIALTANAMATDRDDCLASGCDDYMTKPIDRQRLLAMCARWSQREASAQASENA